MKGGKALEPVKGRGPMESIQGKLHKEYGQSKVAGWRKKSAPGRGNMCIRLEATESRVVFQEL